MIFQNIRIENEESLSDIRVQDGKIAQIVRHANGGSGSENQRDLLLPREGEKVIDGNGGLLLPPMVDSHVHLDTCLSLDKTGPNLTGTLFEGIRIWSSYRQSLTKEKIQERAMRTLELYREKGVQYVRSHVDISSGLTAFEALLELKEKAADMVEIQLCAFPQDGIFTSQTVRKNLEAAAEMGADVIGGIPHFELTREHGERSIKELVGLAVKYGRLLDLHCDEIDDEQSRFLEVLAAAAYETGLGSRASASHTTAMHSYNGAYCDKLFRILSMSGVNIIANPLVNVNLQGRFDTYPKRRGITRVKELLERGINVSLGHDDMYDPFYPLGNGDMTEVLAMGLHLCHMMGYEELNRSWRMITVNGAKTLHLAENAYGIAEGKPANFIIFHEGSFFEALRKRDGVRYSVRNGKMIKEN